MKEKRSTFKAILQTHFEAKVQTFVFSNSFEICSRQSQVKQLEAGDVSLPVTVYCVYYRVSYMCTTHALELQGPDDVCGELLGVCQGHTHHPVRLSPPAGPVLKKTIVSPLRAMD